jgi:hypothetical protein
MEPMLSVYRIGMLVYAVAYMAFLRCVAIFFRSKLLLYHVPFKKHLLRLNSFAYAIGIIAMLFLIAQSIVSLRVSGPIHNALGFTFLGLAAVNIAISSLLFRVLAVNNKERSIWRSMTVFLYIVASFALMTFFQASYAYKWRTTWVNSEILAWCEMSTSLGAAIYPILYRSVLKYMYLDGSFHVGILYQFGLYRLPTQIANTTLPVHSDQEQQRVVVAAEES